VFNFAPANVPEANITQMGGCLTASGYAKGFSPMFSTKIPI
jgi:hypothetical protein